MSAEQTGSGAAGAPLPTDEEIVRALGALFTPTAGVLMEVEEERRRQDAKWGAELGPLTLVGELEKACAVVQAWPLLNYAALRDRLVGLAALAVAAVEAIDRRGGAS